MYLEQLEAAFEADITNIVFTAAEFDALRAEIAAATLEQYDLDELDAFRWKGKVAFGVDYSK